MIYLDSSYISHVLQKIDSPKFTAAIASCSRRHRISD